MNRRSAWLVCLGAVLSACGGDAAPETGTYEQPPIVLIVIDTLRADHLGCYGYDLDTSPRLDAFADQAYHFEANTTQCNATFASLTSILTGLYPKTHLNYLPVPLDQLGSENRGVQSLAEGLQEHGYYTAAGVSHNMWEARPRKMLVGRGWDAFSVIPPWLPNEERIGDAGRADQTNARLFKMLDEWRDNHGEQPPFLWAHYFDPHTAYDPPEPDRNAFLADHLAAAGLSHHFESLSPLAPGKPRQDYINNTADETERVDLRMANGRALYDGEIRFCDRQIGLLFDRLRRDGIFDDAIIVVMADHGENLGGPEASRAGLSFTHKGLYEGVASTPLLVKLPGQRVGRTSRSLTQNIDVMPTIFDLLGLPIDPDVQGASLRPLFDDPDATVHDRVFIESSDHLAKAFKESDLKFIDTGGGAKPSLFRWRTDPRETTDLYDESPPGVRERLTTVMKKFRPLNTVQIRFVPDSRPYTVELEVQLLTSRLEEVIGVEWSSPEKLNRFHWTGTVGADPIEITLFLDRTDTNSRWRLTTDQAGNLQDRVHLGAMPLVNSAALPDWVHRGPPPASPQVKLASAPGGETFEVELVATEGMTTVELSYPWKGTGIPFALHPLGKLEVLESEGFGPLKFIPALAVSGLRVDGPGRVLLATPKTKRGIASLVRIDGRWPAPEQVSLDGQGVAADSLGFWLIGNRLAAAMLGGADAEAAPGSVVIRATASSSPAEIDPETLAPERVDQLRELGYVR
jgi:arylsulfatase A-like enzyme